MESLPRGHDVTTSANTIVTPLQPEASGCDPGLYHSHRDTVGDNHRYRSNGPDSRVVASPVGLGVVPFLNLPSAPASNPVNSSHDQLESGSDVWQKKSTASGSALASLWGLVSFNWRKGSSGGKKSRVFNEIVRDSSGADNAVVAPITATTRMSITGAKLLLESRLPSTRCQWDDYIGATTR